MSSLLDVDIRGFERLPQSLRGADHAAAETGQRRAQFGACDTRKLMIEGASLAGIERAAGRSRRRRGERQRPLDQRQSRYRLAAEEQIGALDDQRCAVLQLK